MQASPLQLLERGPMGLLSKPIRIGVFGATGTGKGVWIMQLLAAEKPARLMIFDVKHDEWLKGQFTDAHTPAALARATLAERFAVRYLVDHGQDIDAQFDFFCRVAWERSRLVMWVDELPEVTKANKAPAIWRKAVNIGRSYTTSTGRAGWLSIIGSGQRAAEVDKSFFSNVNLLHVGRLVYEPDAKAIGAHLGVDWREVVKLPNLAYIERAEGQIEPSRGNITLQKKVKQARPVLRKPP